MTPQRRPFMSWLLVHIFRTSTALITFAGLCAAFLYKPEWLTWWFRTTMKAIESGSEMLPYPWGDRLEVALRGIGGSFWIQITFTIIIVRLLCSAIAFCWRRGRHRP